ncbi:sel1 repeat family protein [Actinomadura barringtoniae]|uniref:Sel1 repeat family protein n=1 Tax=Actinomadura barringtoniae TaxID=1427535 RepID=A0A939P996_9ACTN|nr:tetratricopeptide repeat protein [Actinomadura barringtoniae]MBO2445668.1 sel1 repeat family protein [Actinomadura barringtoniae]
MNDATAMRERGLEARRKGDLAEAERCFQEAFEAGAPQAGHDLGDLMIDRGDKTRAEEWYRRAADQGVADSEFEVGYTEASRGNLDLAESWYRRAAEQGHEGGSLNLGSLLHKRGDLEEAKRHFIRAWEVGSNAMAASNIGLIFDDEGKGDLVSAAEWYGRAADLGNAGAAFNLGFVWADRGEPDKRMEAWKQAADLKHPEAAYAVADVLMSQGEVTEAVPWLRRSATEVGNQKAARKLSQLYTSERMARYWREFPQGPTFYSPELQSFASEVSAASIHQQDVFNDAHGSAYVEWNLDEATVNLGGREFSGLTVLGSFSNLSETWLWAWDNPSYEQDLPCLTELRTIREFGERHQIPEFIMGQSDYSRFNFPSGGAFTMAIAAATLIGAKGVISVTVNDGKGRLVLAVSDPDLPTSEYDGPGAAELIRRAVLVWPYEQRRVVHGFMRHHGFEIEMTPATFVAVSADGHSVSVSCPLERAKEHPEVAAILGRDNAEVNVSPAQIRGRRPAGPESADPRSAELVALFDLDDRLLNITGG